tara:strand:+ start:301 stop:1014 length:714 start_codon:yes stop_codon:yes gene_type:complete
MTKRASEKRKTFNREFREARAAFRMNPIEKNFTFISKVDGGKKTVLRKGETKQGLMKKFKAEFNSAAPTKTTDSIPGYLKRKAAGKRIVKNTKLADVTKEELNAWKEKNKGLYKGKALTAYLNAKGKNLSKPKTVASAKTKALVGSGKQHLRSKVDTSRKAGELSATGKAIVAKVKQDDRSEKNLNRNPILRQQQASNATLKVFYALSSKQKLDVNKLIRKEGLTLSAAIKRITKGK